MTAEEYLETRRCKSAISNNCDECYMDAAYKAVEMTRKEEREKAIKALNIVLMAIFEKGNHSMSMGDLIGHFEKLLNQ